MDGWEPELPGWPTFEVPNPLTPPTVPNGDMGKPPPISVLVGLLKKAPPLPWLAEGGPMGL